MVLTTTPWALRSFLWLSILAFIPQLLNSHAFNNSQKAFKISQKAVKNSKMRSWIQGRRSRVYRRRSRIYRRRSRIYRCSRIYKMRSWIQSCSRVHRRHSRIYRCSIIQRRRSRIHRRRLTLHLRQSWISLFRCKSRGPPSIIDIPGRQNGLRNKCGVSPRRERAAAVWMRNA